MTTVSVIIPARDAATTLPATLAGLAAQGAPDLEVVVVDDGSADATAAIARDGGATVVAGEGGGPALARNAGAVAASGEVLVFVDADVEPQPGWLAAGLAALEDADVVQGRVIPRLDRAIGPFDKSLSVQGDSGLYESANLFVRRTAFDAVGGFESWLRPRSGIELGEDVLLGWSAIRQGLRVVYAPEALAWHEVFPRDAAAFVAEHVRRSAFPALVARVPELRGAFLTRRLWITRRSMWFDLGLVGLLLALLTRRPTPVLAAAPWLVVAGTEARRWGRRRAPVVLATYAAADAVSAVALAAGSARARTVVL